MYVEKSAEMPKTVKFRFAATVKIILLIAMAVVVVLISNAIFVSVIPWDESFLLFVEGGMFLVIGALFAVGPSDTPVDVILETYHRGVPLRPEPMREGYGSNKRTSGEKRTGIVLMIIGIILIALAFVVFLVA